MMKNTPPPPQTTHTRATRNNLVIGRVTVIHSRITIRGPAIIGDHSDIEPNTYISPYTTIGDRIRAREDL